MSWSFYVWTIYFWETNGQKQCSSSIAFTPISLYRLDNQCRKCKKTKTYGLVLLFHLQGRVAHFDRNPALPKDQPLRGSWLDCHSFLSNHAQKSIIAYPEFMQAIDYEFEIDHKIPTRVGDKTQSLCLLLRSTSWRESHFFTCPILFRGHGFLSQTRQLTLPSFAFSWFREYAF